MMKRRLVFISALLAIAVSVSAQKFCGGLMVGPVFSTMSLSGNDTTTLRTDFTGGVRIAYIPKHSFFGIEADVVYSRQGMSSKLGRDENNNGFRYKSKSHYINVPLLLNVYFRRWNEDDEDESRIPCLRIGPQIGFCIGGNDIMELTETQKKQYILPWKNGSFNRIDYGITAAMSYWFIELRYTFGMANVFKEEGKSTNHVFSITWSDIW